MKKKHVNKIANKCSKTTGVLNKLKHVLPLDIKTLLYNSLILSHINYCITVWGYKGTVEYIENSLNHFLKFKY